MSSSTSHGMIGKLRYSQYKPRYLRALAAFYIRMTFRPADVYEVLEPLLKDYRKIRYRGMGESYYIGLVRHHFVHPHSGGYSIVHMDEFIDQLLNEERVCDLILPRLTKRDVLEELDEIGPRKSRLLDAMEGKSEHGSQKSRSRSRSSDRSGGSRSPSGTRNRSASGSPGRGRSLSRGSKSPSPAGSRYVSRSRSRSRSGSGSPYRSRSRSISPDRLNGSAGGSPARFRSRSRSISPDRMDTTG